VRRILHLTLLLVSVCSLPAGWCPKPPMPCRWRTRMCRCHPPVTLLSSCPGPYLDDPKVAKEFTDAYMEMVGGFLTFPLKFPGTAVWRAMKVCTCARSRAPAYRHC
jgi:hypothetical protein